MAAAVVSGFLAALDEDPRIQTYALKELDKCIDEAWPEVVVRLQRLELLSEDESFQSRALAALVASKTYFHVGRYEPAMIFALRAGELFNFQDHSEYCQTLVGKFLDEYVRLRSDETSSLVSSRVEELVEALFRRCYELGEFDLALGVAIEARRLDKVREVFDKVRREDRLRLLEHCLRISYSHVASRAFRNELQALLLTSYLAEPTESIDYARVCELQTNLSLVSDLSSTLLSLSTAGGDSTLLAYQIAFDLVDTAPQTLVSSLLTSLSLPSLSPPPPAPLLSILSGLLSTQLFFSFLSSSNHTDAYFIKRIKACIESRTSIAYSMMLICNALLSAGTSSESFLREHLDWLRRASNWSKFLATASLGVIHLSSQELGKARLSNYLVDGSSAYVTGGALFALGLMYARAVRGEGVEACIRQLRERVEGGGGEEVVVHGGCLGLGVCAMGSGDASLFEMMKVSVLYADGAVAGEAAGVAMGMVMVGTADKEALQDMLAYAHDTAKEKVVRGVALGVAMMMYGRGDEADTLIESLCLDKDPILRYGGMFTVALAYAGTGEPRAIRRLLHLAVSDVSDDVRRAAVMALGFVLTQQPAECPRLVSLLLTSYNPHLRYGACMAVGIACAGTVLPAAVDLLEPMTKDKVDFVRQGAYIALALVLQETSAAAEPRADALRKLLLERLGMKHEDLMAKFGAAFACGILDGGGRNCVVSLTRGGRNSMRGVVGMALFCQYWYWHPFALFLSLALRPTAVIGVNKDLQCVEFAFRSNAPPDMYGYPPMMQPEAKKKEVKVKAAELSVTKRAHRRMLEKEKEKERREREGGVSASTSLTNLAALATSSGGLRESAASSASAMDVDELPATSSPAQTHGSHKTKPKESILHSPARVTLPQLQVISFDVDERYRPLKRAADALGVVVLKDLQPERPVVLAKAAQPAKEEPTAQASPAALAQTPAQAAPPQQGDAGGPQGEAPAPFEFDPSMEE